MGRFNATHSLCITKQMELYDEMRFFFGFLRNGNSSVREIDLILFWFSCEIPSYSATKTGVVFFFRKLLDNVVSFKVFYTKEYNVDVYCFFVKGKLHM